MVYRVYVSSQHAHITVTISHSSSRSWKPWARLKTSSAAAPWRVALRSICQVCCSANHPWLSCVLEAHDQQNWTRQSWHGMIGRIFFKWVGNQPPTRNLLESCFERGSLPKDCTAQHFAHLSNEVTRFLQQRATELKSRVLAATADRAEADPVAKVDEGW